MRIALLLVGALVMSIGLGYLLTLEETVVGTIEETIEQRWRSSYDILVRPPGSVSELEGKYNIVEPNALAGLGGGITRAQWEQIRNLPDIEVAAPIANLGLAPISATIPWVSLDGPAIFRIRETFLIEDGLDGKTSMITHYAYRGSFDATPDAVRELRPLGLEIIPASLGWYRSIYNVSVPIAAVDPVEEAKLVGLKRAVIQGSYLTAAGQAAKQTTDGGWVYWKIPVIASATPYVREGRSIQIERLEIPDADPLAAVRMGGGRSYLEQLSGKLVFSGVITPEDLHNRVLEAVSQTGGTWQVVTDLLGQPGSATYREDADSALKKRWPTILEAVAQGAYAVLKDDGEASGGIRWRSAGTETLGLRIGLDVMGLFDTGKLDLPLDPLNELPMETYRPPTALQRLDEEKRPVNPPRTLLPTDVAHGLFTAPPVLLTTLDTAAKLRGEAPISAIRIRVRGAASATEESQRKLEDVAAEITRLTGLKAEITAGSSPRRVLVHIPGWEGSVPVFRGFEQPPGEALQLRIPGIGYFEQPWVQKGAGIALIREVRLGRSILVVSILVVGSLFVFVTSFISAQGWKKEMALLASQGLSPRGIIWFVTGESLFFGLLVAAFGLVVAFLRKGSDGIGGSEALAVVVLPLVVYGAGSLPAAISLAWSSPMEALRSAGTDNTVPRFRLGPTVAGLAVASLGRRPWRSLLSLLALGVPASLIGVFGFITLRLRGELFLTWLGEYVTLQVGPTHYVAAAVALAIAALATTDSIWVKVQERAAEISLLGALGVPPRAIFLAVVMEGMAVGLLGGLVGAISASVMLRVLYGSSPPAIGLVWGLAIVVPMICAAGAAQIPAWGALRIPPAQGIREE